jgi:long-chain-fatty-acid--CoA ligase ACSBG
MNQNQTGVGEICIYGCNLFMGYLNNQSKTDEIVDSYGYLHNADLEKIDEDGFLFITGRIKELINGRWGERSAYTN